MKFYYMLLISSLVSCLQARLFGSWSPRYWGHHYQRDCYDKCPEGRMAPFTYKQYLGKYLGCLFLKAFDIIYPNFQPISSDPGDIKEEKITAVQVDQSLKDKVVEKMLEYARRDNCLNIDKANDELLFILSKKSYLASDLFGFSINQRPLYSNSCIKNNCLNPNTDESKKSYLTCLFKEAAQNVFLQANYVSQEDIDEAVLSITLFANHGATVKHFIKNYMGEIIKTMKHYNQLDIESITDDGKYCFDISHDLEYIKKIIVDIWNEL